MCIQCVNREIHAHEIPNDNIRSRKDAYNRIIEHNRHINEVIANLSNGRYDEKQISYKYLPYVIEE